MKRGDEAMRSDGRSGDVVRITPMRSRMQRRRGVGMTMSRGEGNGEHGRRRREGCIPLLRGRVVGEHRGTRERALGYMSRPGAVDVHKRLHTLHACQ